MQGIDTAGQVVLTPQAELLAAHRSWKSGNGLKRQELLDWAAAHGGPVEQREQWRLSWLLISERYFQQDLGRNAPDAFCSADGALHHARKMRRPLVRVEGAALKQLEQHSLFLQRHARQFWWQESPADGRSRLVVLNASELDEAGKPSELTGRCSTHRVPTVMTTIDLDTIDLTHPEQLDKVSAELDECWRAYMERRPSNAENLTFARDNIGRFQDIDSQIRRLAQERHLLAPGGRALMTR